MPATETKILLTVTEVVEHSVAVSEDQEKAYRRQEEKREAEAAARDLAQFKTVLAERLDIDAGELEEPVLHFQHGDARFGIKLAYWSSLTVALACTKCGKLHAGSGRADNHRELGDFVRSKAGPRFVCWDCAPSDVDEDGDPVGAPRPPKPEPTTAERLYELIREIALTEALGARE